MEVQKCCSDFAEEDSSCHDDDFHVHTFVVRKNRNGCSKFLPFPETHMFIEDSQLLSRSVWREDYNMFRIELYHDVHSEIPKRLNECV